jgi:hypothetical protein
MHHIPFDILETIIPLCDDRDLPTLSQVNRTLQDLAERRLYADIGFIDIARTCRILNSIVHSTFSRGRFVLNFWIHDSYFHVTNPSYQLFGGFYHLLGQALRRMSNLQFLFLRLRPSKAWVIRNCTMQLSMVVTNIPAGRLLASWLELQRRLVVFLHADTSSHPIPRDFIVSAKALSHLKFIGARGHVLNQLVPGRPVVCAFLSYMDDYMYDGEHEEGRVDYIDVMHALEASTGPLHTFGVHFRPLTRDTIQSVIPFFATQSFELPEVRILDLHWPRNEGYIMSVSSDIPLRLLRVE